MRTFYPASLLTFLNTGAPYQRADLWTFTLQSGTVLRFTNHDVLVDKGGGVTYSPAGPIITRSRVRQLRGLQVSELTLNVAALPTHYVYGTVPWLRALRAGVFDYAEVTLDVGIFDIGIPRVLKGWYNWFEGQVSHIPRIDLMRAEVVVKNQMQRLQMMMPRNLVQPGCVNTLFDKACGVSKAAWTVTGSITSVNSDGSLVCSITGGTPANDIYNEGTLTITSGDNQNVVRKIKRNVGNTFSLFAPLPFTAPGGTTLTVRRGCAKTRTACQGFSNEANYRGFPYVPTPETIL